jgi:acyl carrier protein
MEQQILDVFCDVFSAPTNVDTGELIYNDYPGWDSVGHMTLVAALEEKFDCMLEMDDILDMSSYAKVCEIMSRVIADG